MIWFEGWRYLVLCAGLMIIGSAIAVAWGFR